MLEMPDIQTDVKDLLEFWDQYVFNLLLAISELTYSHSPELCSVRIPPRKRTTKTTHSLSFDGSVILFDSLLLVD